MRVRVFGRTTGRINAPSLMATDKVLLRSLLNGQAHDRIFREFGGSSLSLNCQGRSIANAVASDQFFDQEISYHWQ